VVRSCDFKSFFDQSKDRKLCRKRPLDYAFAVFKELLNSFRKHLTRPLFLVITRPFEEQELLTSKKKS